jgi:hypothetical protein
MRTGFRFSLLAISLLLLALPCAARAANGDVYFGYSRLGANAFHANTPGLNGWQAAGQVKFIPFVGVDLDVAHYGLGAAATLPHTTTVMIGPRVTVGIPGVHVWGHGLVGAEHSSNSGAIISSTSITLDAGAGADFSILPYLAWRISGDYINAPNQSPSTADRYRFGTGLALHF